eukprot:10444048-Alexandrium_andersonii.AAC.1
MVAAKPRPLPFDLARLAVETNYSTALLTPAFPSTQWGGGSNQPTEGSPGQSLSQASTGFRGPQLASLKTRQLFPTAAP